jgi:hypothetical protein
MMLCDVDIGVGSPLLAASLLRPEVETRRIAQGLYQINHWNFELQFRGRQVYELDFPKLDGDFWCFGVCDSPEQLLSLLPPQVTAGPERFVVAMVRLLQIDEPAEGGWRWHKWGPYIGTQEPQQEYLADEPVIEEVWTYHVYRLDPPKLPDPA